MQIMIVGDEDLFTEMELAEFLGTTGGCVRKQRCIGRGPRAIKVRVPGRKLPRVMYRPVDIAAWFNETKPWARPWQQTNKARRPRPQKSLDATPRSLDDAELVERL